MNELKNLFKSLQIDAKSVLFTEENINDKFFKKIKKSRYEKDIEFVKLFDRNEIFLEDEKSTIPIKTMFVEKKDDIDRSTLYSLDGPFQFLHADVGNLEFLGKSATNPKYCLLFINLFTSKVNVYPMKSRKSILNKKEIFYKEVEGKRKSQKTRLQTDQEFNQKKIFDLNKKFNVDMFLTAVKGGKVFAAEQELRELKKTIFRLIAMEKRLSKKQNPNEIIKKSVENMNSLPHAKYK